MEKFKDQKEYLLSNNVYEREALVWGEYTYDDSQLVYTENWLHNRILYLDKYFEQYEAVLAAREKRETVVKLFPNPANEYIVVECGSQSYELCIQDLNGRIIAEYTLKGNNKIALDTVAKGVYVATIKSGDSFVKRKIVIN